MTLAEVLRAGGYRTYMCGKWHVTNCDGPKDDNSNWPVQRGFDKFYGTIRGYGNFFDPSSLCRQNTFITPENDPEYKPKEFYYTDALSDNAVRFLQQHQQESPDKPFFMYLAYTAAHWPMQALEKDIAKYRGKFDRGYEPLRQARLERLKKLGLIDPEWECAPTVGDWDGVKRKRWEARCMEVFAAMIDNMDQGIGRILRRTQELRPPRQHRHPLPERQRRLRRGHGPHPPAGAAGVGAQAHEPGHAPGPHPAADADARRPPGASPARR